MIEEAVRAFWEMRRVRAAALWEGRLRQLAEHLDRDALVQAEVRARGDDTHPAVAQDRVDTILVEQDLADGYADIGWSCRFCHRVTIVACVTTTLKRSCV